MAVRQFIEWLYEQEIIEHRPRNLNRTYARVKLPKPSPLFFTADEVRKIFDAATPRTKLYVALAVNCGYTQIDIATLTHGMVDWTKGVIVRNRNKSGVPQVHKLWSGTMDLLRSQMTAETRDGLMLIDENGNQLVRQRIGDKGHIVTNDAIKLAFDRTMKRVEMDKDPRRFKVFRKTSSNEIERAFPEYPHLASDFLAHGETATKRYYVVKHHDQLFRAIDHLSNFYNLTFPPTEPT